jgi:hypothetical protein
MQRHLASTEAIPGENIDSHIFIPQRIFMIGGHPTSKVMSPISDTHTLGLFYSDIGGENLVVTKGLFRYRIGTLSTILADSDIGLETISTLKFFSSIGITQNSSNPILKNFRPCLFPLDQDDDRHRISMVISIRYSSWYRTHPNRSKGPLN